MKKSVVPIASSVSAAPTPCPCGSGRTFTECHGAAPAAPPVVLAPSDKLLKLDLACGQRPREGFEGVDLWAPAQHKVDLMKFPWPWADDSVSELHSSHFVEHLPARDVEPRDLVDDNPQMRDRFVGVDFFFAFFNECWRILKDKGTMLVIVPALRSNRAFQDPTHRRFIAAETFAYLSAEWRKAQGLDHYPVRCNFQGQCNHTVLSELTTLHPEAQARRFNESWNVIIDWHASLVALKS